MSNNEVSAGNEMNVFSKVINVFAAPRKTFESIDRKPDWFYPLLIVVIVATIMSIFIMPIAMDQQMEEQRIKLQERGMSEAEIDQALEMGRSYGEKFGSIGAFLGTVVYLVLIALLVLFIGNIILGGKSSFKKVFSVVNYTSLVGSLGSLILLPIILSKKSINVHFSLATFLSEDASETILYQILKSVDFFWIWQIMVAGIGMAVIYKMSTKKTTTALAVAYVIFVLIGIGFKSLV